MNLNFYRNEEERIESLLLEKTPGTDEYQALLRDLNNLTYVSIQTLDAAERLGFAEEDEAPAAPIKLTPLTPVEPEPEETTGPTYDEVKAVFSTAARNGVKVGDIIADFGYARLSEVPPEKYADLLAALGG